MQIKDIFAQKKVTLSFEVFPPKQQGNLGVLPEKIKALSALRPDFISVTCGAGGSTQGQTLEVSKMVAQNGAASLTHLTCVSATKEKIAGDIKEMKAAGIQNILALRGDIPQGMTEEEATRGGYKHADELTAILKQEGFCVGGACYPEGHPESAGLNDDIEKLKIKVDNGVEFLVTQMFFDNDVMYNYMYRLLAHGITVPVVPGVMPVTNAKQIQHICKLSGTKLPLRFRAIVEKYGDDPEAMKQAGINYATAQVLDLLANGFMDVHIYTMNRPEIIGGILKNLSCIVK